MGSLEEVITVSLAEMEDGKIVDHEVDIKVFIKYCLFLFSEEQIEKILDKATKKWLVKERRLGRRKT